MPCSTCTLLPCPSPYCHCLHPLNMTPVPVAKDTKSGRSRSKCHAPPKMRRHACTAVPRTVRASFQHSFGCPSHFPFFLVVPSCHTAHAQAWKRHRRQDGMGREREIPGIQLASFSGQLAHLTRLGRNSHFQLIHFGSRPCHCPRNTLLHLLCVCARSAQETEWAYMCEVRVLSLSKHV
jgi:hypothetical protein